MDNISFLVLLICGLIFAEQACCSREEGRIKRDSRRRPSQEQQRKWRMTAAANRFFAHKIYPNIVRSRPDGNLLISPFVISTGLSMVLLGARGITEVELMDTLEYSNLGTKKMTGKQYTKTDVAKSYYSLLSKTRSNAAQGGYTFSVASKLFGEKTENFLQEFVRNTAKYYDAKFEAVDFAHDSEGARQHINEWVGNETYGVIDEAVPPGSVTSGTLLTLVSTAYFKGAWVNQFDPENTSPGIFQLRNGSETMVNFMHGRFTVLYKHSSVFNGEIVILPYKTLDTRYGIRMELFLPYDDSGLTEIEILGEGAMNQELRNLRLGPLDLYLPKFRLDYEMDLRANLETLGLHSLFGAADLSGMNERYNLNIANARHKSFIQVNEEGTTAGASVALITERSSSTDVVRFDRPFFFMIRETHTNSVLFMGRVERPN